MMNRRQMLTNLGLVGGYIAVTPTVLSLLQSCTKEKNLSWTPEFLSVQEAQVLEILVDKIIPETDTPGAKTLGIPQFIDTYMQQVVAEEEALMFKKAAGRLLLKLGIENGKEVADITEEEFEMLLSENLKADTVTLESYHEALESVQTPDDFDNLSEEATIFGFISAVRGLTIFGFKNTEAIGENVLAYLPVPGGQIGCIPVAEATGGKAWSL